MEEEHLSQFDPDCLQSEGDYAGVAIRDGALAEEGLDAVSMADSLLSKVRGPKVKLAKLQLTGVVVRDSDFSNGTWEKARLSSVCLSRCRLTGWNAAEAVFRNVRFTGCRMDLALLHGATLVDCLLEACDLREADFQGARLKNVAFRTCDLRSARFPGAALAGVDLRGSHLAGVQADASALRGSVVDRSQLLDLAGVFGLEVREPDTA